MSSGPLGRTRREWRDLLGAPLDRRPKRRLVLASCRGDRHARPARRKRDLCGHGGARAVHQQQRHRHGGTRRRALRASHGRALLSRHHRRSGAAGVFLTRLWNSRELNAGQRSARRQTWLYVNRQLMRRGSAPDPSRGRRPPAIRSAGRPPSRARVPRRGRTTGRAGAGPSWGVLTASRPGSARTPWPVAGPHLRRRDMRYR